MLKRVLLTIVACILILSFVSCNNDTDIQAENGFNTAQELAEKFVSAGKNGDLSSIYDMYYNDMLNDTYERVNNHLTKDQFDSLLKQEMARFSDYELFEYGCEEMPASVSPLYYVDYLFYGTTGTETGLTEDMVTSCANLRVNIDNSFTDHMLAQIDGLWYVIL